MTLGSVAYGGDAVGRLDDGRAVFVAFGLPGEVVRVELTESKQRFARGRIVEVIKAAPERITPRCRHFGLCGGCHYQHMRYEDQLTAKTEILRDQLERIGRIKRPPIQPTEASPHQWNYRNQVQFHRTGSGKLGYFSAGNEGAGRRHVFEIEECHLPEAPINALWPQLQFTENKGIERVRVRAGTDGDLLMILEADSAEDPDIKIAKEISVAHLFGQETVTITGKDHVVLRVLGREFRVSAASFFQVNTAMAEKMVEYVVAHVPNPTGTLADVYCGVGLFSAFLADRCTRLIGVESSTAACKDYATNLDEFSNVELYEDAAERALPALGLQADVVLVDPPRAGVERQALDAIVDMAPATLIYVSCDPATLARDARRLAEAAYRLLEVKPFDLFPQTYHIESISIFGR